ncbi:uncharacterized protein LOC131012546 isoform X3 [Salvia miltiorrhiza]|uniref:uncharacterized protein LOC131012496 isoform X3 n=1 Tax=Salvia miltiorrhiza TaxID=226208 RepID=UPI0025AC3ECF|nr:uncharacterized protein LOC131012496 isoform X3 [Salvia miltiorrhiza]XP_057796512.1 uncharacterized protein LOC131012546 isoform X3 [Salvia miltiorrhiza]
MKLRRRKCIPSCASHQGVDGDELYWDGKKRDKESAWSHNSAHVISQLAQCFTNAMVGPRSWVGGFFSRANNRRFGSSQFLDYNLTPMQEERLQSLKQRLGVPYDETRSEHQSDSIARKLFKPCGMQPSRMLSLKVWYPSSGKIWAGREQIRRLISGAAASSHSRTCYISPELTRLLLKKAGERSEWEYPFAVAGINVSFMLIQMLDLHSEKPRCLPGFNFLTLLGEDEDAFDILYCIAFTMMDAQWLAMHASYMEFNEVLQVTRTQLERELSLEDVRRIQDLPAYNFLFQ